jgi:hypothetical protein
MQWRGTSVQNLHIRVCDTCYDVPSEFLRTLILPPDPMPVMDARTEPYTIDEINALTLSAIVGVPFMFFDQSSMIAELAQVPPVIIGGEDGVGIAGEDGVAIGGDRV